MAELGERIAALVASFEAEKHYQHDRWHKLANDLTPVISLPERMTREIGKLQGTVEGRLNSITKEIERSMEAAIEKAVKPVTDDVSRLEAELATVRSRVQILEKERAQWSGAKRFVVYAIQTIVATISAAAAISVILWRR